MSPVLPDFRPSAPDTEELDHSQGLYKHKKRDDWGYAILAWERGDKRGYQFADGKLRVFKEGFYSLFEEVDPPDDAADSLVEELNTRLERARKHRIQKKRGKAPEPEWSFKDQLHIFHTLYPKGFQDPAWQEQIRGVDTSRRLKRHRNPAIEETQEKLAESRMDKLITAGQFTVLRKECYDLFDATTLVSKSHIRQLESVDPEGDKELILALRNLLYNDNEHYAKRFERWVEALKSASGRTPHWQLATAPAALIHPQEHVCVRPSTFRKQAAELNPRLYMTREPTARAYVEHQEMAELCKNRLKDKDLGPEDLIDVHDFIWATLRPSAEKYLKD